MPFFPLSYFTYDIVHQCNTAPCPFCIYPIIHAYHAEPLSYRTYVMV